MLPSRGLRPAQFVPLASRQSTLIRSNASRKFSSIPRNNALSTLPNRASPLQSSRWRTGATASPNVVLSASTVRYGSWYAPWTWGRSSTPQPPQDAVTTPSEIIPEPAPVTTATPELAPAGIDKAATVESTAAQQHQTMDELLSLDPTANAVPVAEIDPTRPIDHLGQLKELGLDYGWGTSTMFENLIERLYLFTDLEWAGCVIASSIILRVGLFAFQAMSSDRMAKIAAMKPVMEPLQAKMEAAKKAGDHEKANLYRRQQGAIMGANGKDLLAMPVLMIAQIAVGFGAFRCLRGISSLPVPGLTEQNFLWINDLTVSDPYYLLPLIAGGTMWAVMKKGGETGVTQAQTTMQRPVMTFMAGFFTLITAFQPAILQIYFVCSSVLGGITGWALRQNGFRRFIRIRPLPTRESNEVFSKIANGELKLKDVRGPDGKIRYQAPTRTITTTTTTRTPGKQNPNEPIVNRGVNVKAGTVIPAHLRKAAPQIDKEFPDRDVDFEEGMPAGSLGDKFGWVRRNYKPSFVWRRMSAKWENRDRGIVLQERKKDRARRAAEEYEYERRKRFENRR